MIIIPGKKNTILKNIFLPALIVFISGLIVFNAGCCTNKTEKTGKPRLVLMVVIDSLRADIVSRLEHRFGKNGFKYLIDKGTWYKNSRYRFATTITSVGHAVIFTGALPTNNGIVGNSWYDREMGKAVSSTEIPDPKNPGKILIGPYQLTSSTIGDELVKASNKQNKVFNVSFKDRGAILPGGYLGKAFWFKKGNFVTDEYYYNPKDYPKWLTDWNNQKKADQYRHKSWELLQDKSSYIYGNRDERTEEMIQKAAPYLRARSKFPHFLSSNKDDEFYDKLAETPFLDNLTVEFACHVLKEEKLGQGKFTDMLTVSLSVTDIIGHTYGPDSLEYEDNILHMDKSLEKLFSYIDKTIGLMNTLIVVTADHGVDSIPEYSEALGMPAGRIDFKNFETEINQAIQTKFKIPNTEKFFIKFANPSIFLDENVVAKNKLNIEEVEKTAADALMKIKGIAVAVTHTDLLKGNVQDSPLMSNLKLVFHPKRSGNILIMQEPFRYLYPDISDAAMHGSPYNYDTHVPLFFAGPKIPKQEVYRLVCPEDIAVTVALMLGIQAPPAASGNALTEIFK